MELAELEVGERRRRRPPASTGPAPIAPRGLVVRLQRAAAPPVARTVAAAPIGPPSVSTPWQRSPSLQSAVAEVRSRTSIRGSAATIAASFEVISCPVWLPPEWTMRRLVWPPSRPSASSAVVVEVEDDAPLRSSSRTAAGASSTSTSHRGGAAEAAAGGDRVGGVAFGRVAGLERRGEAALGPEAGALGERRAGDEADAAAVLGRAAARSRARPRRRRRRRRRTRRLGLSPLSLSADRVELLAQPGGRAFAGPGLVVDHGLLRLFGPPFGLLDALLRRLGLGLDLGQPLLRGLDRPLLRLALALQLFLVGEPQLLAAPPRPRRAGAPSPPPAPRSRRWRGRSAVVATSAAACSCVPPPRSGR